jgi:sugar-phosphatase
MTPWTGAAVIFDLDGVLIDADSIYERHWEQWADARGVDFDAVLAVHHGRPAIETIRAVAPHLDAAAEAAAFNAALAGDDDATGIRVHEGVATLLTALHPGHWAIATSAPRTTALGRLASLGLPLPTVLVTIDDVAAGKPAPDPYLAAAKGLAADITECLVVEDAPAGITSAKTAGAHVVAVTTTHDREQLGQADDIVGTIDSLRVRPAGNGVSVAWDEFPVTDR